MSEQLLKTKLQEALIRIINGTLLETAEGRPSSQTPPPPRNIEQLNEEIQNKVNSHIERESTIKAQKIIEYLNDISNRNDQDNRRIQALESRIQSLESRVSAFLGAPNTDT